MKVNNDTTNKREALSQADVVNKCNEIEGGMLIAAKAQRVADDALNDDVHKNHNPFNLKIPKKLFYLELSCGSGRLSTAPEETS